MPPYLILTQWTLLDAEEDGLEQANLAGIVNGDGVCAAHHNLRHILIHGTLAVAYIWHIFDHNLANKQGSKQVMYCTLELHSVR